MEDEERVISRGGVERGGVETSQGRMESPTTDTGSDERFGCYVEGWGGVADAEGC